MMTDEQQMAYQQRLAQLPLPVPAAAAVAPVPPAPPPPVAGQTLPPAVVVYCPAPPPPGGLVIQDFDRLPPPAAFVPAPVVAAASEEPVCQRLLQVSLQLGDNLFLRGRFREAHAQFELALSLCPHHAEINLRIARCRPSLPPAPPPVVIAPPPPVAGIPVPISPAVLPPRPRIAVLNFLVNADPGRTPPGFGDWAAEQLAGYFTPAYEVVDRGEVCWWMGRLGMTMRDVVTDASSRRWLGRALNIRFFVFGAIQQTASFDVTTHMVDVESGCKQGGGRIHVQDHQELKLRLGELAGQTRTDPAEQQRLRQEAAENEKVLNEARRLCQAGQPAQAVAVCQEGLKRHPDHVGLQALLNQAEAQVRQQEQDKQRRQAVELQQAGVAADRARQAELARQAEAARLRAAQQATALGEAARRAREQQRQRAADQLVALGQQARARGNYPQSVQLLESALALASTDAAKRELAQTRAQAQQGAVARQVAEQSRRADADAAQARVQVEEERRKRDLEAQARLRAQQEQDAAACANLVAAARRSLQQQQYAAAVVSLQSARRLHPTAEVQALLVQTQAEQARAEAQRQGAQAQAELDQRLTRERAAARESDDQAKRNQERYAQAMGAAQQSMAGKRYDDAVARYQQAMAVFRTDVALTGLRQAEAARDRERDAALAAKRKQDGQQQREADVRRLLQQGDQALQARQFDRAGQAFTQAGKLSPGNAEALAGLSRVERARADDSDRARRAQADGDRLAAERRLLESGRAAMAAGQWAAAAQAFAQAHQLAPADLAVTQALRDLEKARTGPPETEAQKRKRLADYQAAMKAGRQALAARRYDEAARAFTLAGRLVPGDQEAAALLKEADRAKNPPVR
jgi:tetratricopeptide (TPR) repeat protein